MSLSYHPLHLADVSVHAVAVHQLLAHLVVPFSLRHSSKLVRCPPAIEPVPDLRILNQPIDRSLKMLVLGQIDPVNLSGLHLPLQHLHVKENYICMSK
jgi:hypothetical protein